MPSPAPSIARSALWNHLGKVADYALMYVVSVLIARGLGVDVYGRYTALISLLHVLLVASSFGLEVALTRYGAGLQGASVDERLRFLFRRGASVRVILFLVAAIAGGGVAIATGWAHVSADLTILLLLGGYALSRAVLPLFAAIMTARFRTDRVAVISVAGRMCELAGIMMVGTAGITLPTVLGVLCIAGAVQVGLHLVWNAGAWWGPETSLPLAPVFVFGGVFWLNALVDYFLGRQGDIALLAMIGGDPAATSRYDVSYTLMQAGAMIATLGLSGVSLAALSRFGEHDAAPRTRLYESLVRINSLLTIPILGFLFVAAPDILEIIYAGPFVGAATVLRLLVGIRILTRIYAGGENADLLLSMDMVKPLVVIGMIAAAVTVALHLVLIPRYAAEGAAVASGLGTLAANAMGIHRARKVLPVAIQWRSWLAITGVTAVAGITAHLVVPAVPALAMLVVKGIVFGIAWLLPAVIVRPLEMHDAAVFGRSLSLLRKPMELLSRRETTA
jgi:O-antigen/teichoic acid export membrane protein